MVCMPDGRKGYLGAIYIAQSCDFWDEHSQLLKYVNRAETHMVESPASATRFELYSWAFCEADVRTNWIQNKVSES